MKNVVSKNGVWKTAPLNDTPSGGPLVVTDTDGTLDKTWQEIYDAAPAVIFGRTRNDGKKLVTYLENVYESDGSYIVTCGAISEVKVEDVQFIASSASGYPALDE